jgi:hypothetical protein
MIPNSGGHHPAKMRAQEFHDRLDDNLAAHRLEFIPFLTLMENEDCVNILLRLARSMPGTAR